MLFAPEAFANQRILITGAAGGIGAATADLLANSGASLVLVDYDVEGLEGLKERIASDVIELHTTDLTSHGDIERLVGSVTHSGNVDHLVLAAGVYEDVTVADMTDEQWSRTLTVNLEANFRIVRGLIPHLNNHGSIVLLGSVSGERGSAFHAHYAASKGALLSFARSIAWELGDRDIRANLVTPGVIDTQMTERLVETHRGDFEALTPLKRLGRVEEVANVIAFLCSSGASYLTGNAIQVNGGLHMA